MSSKIHQFLSMGVIKTCRFNYKYFGIDGLIHPRFIIARNVLLQNLKGTVICDNTKKPSNIGFAENLSCIGRRDKTVFSNEGTLYVSGHISLFRGCGLIIRPDAEVRIGNNLSMSQCSVIQSYKKITIGDNCTISWDCLIMDSDTHPIYNIENEELLNPNKEIDIGNHVWICSNVKVLKGSKVASNSIIGAGSVVTKQLSEPNCIYVNNSISKRGITFDTSSKL